MRCDRVETDVDWGVEMKENNTDKYGMNCHANVSKDSMLVVLTQNGNNIVMYNKETLKTAIDLLQEIYNKAIGK